MAPVSSINHTRINLDDLAVFQGVLVLARVKNTGALISAPVPRSGDALFKSLIKLEKSPCNLWMVLEQCKRRHFRIEHCLVRLEEPDQAKEETLPRLNSAVTFPLDIRLLEQFKTS
jgi:hypothetical protein